MVIFPLLIFKVNVQTPVYTVCAVKTRATIDFGHALSPSPWPNKRSEIIKKNRTSARKRARIQGQKQHLTNFRLWRPAGTR
jgi:hypothetical protein